MMVTDLEIAQAAKPRRVDELAEELGIGEDYLVPYGKYKGKLDLSLLDKLKDKPSGKLVLVTAITPTPAGEGKTTVSIGLADGLRKIGKKSILALREPSLGPVFGLKGGAAGGGHAQVIPMEDINLHFTGDLHAIGTANNLLAAMIDNQLQKGNKLGLDPRRISWHRCLDMNDRALRNTVIGLGGPVNGVPREEHFDITAASEVMAIFCLATSRQDLKDRLSHIVVGERADRSYVEAASLKAEGAMAAVLKDALCPNLVQSLEGTPALVHGGPFANIAHGCNSILASQMALKLSDYAITEAGFGSDLGAEKFLDIKCRAAGFYPDACVMVATARSLAYHGGADWKKKDYSLQERLAFEREGLANLKQHLFNMKEVYGLPVVCAINVFSGDQEEELALIEEACTSWDIPWAVCQGWAEGGEGMTDLAREVARLTSHTDPLQPHFAYELDQPVQDKISRLATRIYHADGVDFSRQALQSIRRMEEAGYGRLPVCVAKTQYSFSDQAVLRNAPRDFRLQVQSMRLSAGAGFAVALAGDINTMPGLPSHPAAEGIDMDSQGKIRGLF